MAKPIELRGATVLDRTQDRQTGVSVRSWLKSFLAKLRSGWLTLLELLSFLKTRRLWWLYPLILALILLSVALLIVEKSSLYPFIYVLF